MRSSSVFFAVAVAIGASGCGSQGPAYSGVQDCFVDAPCDTDPSQTCKVPCEKLPGGPIGHGGGGGSTGTGGAGGGAVDVNGSVVIVSDSAFGATVPYTGPVHVIAPGADAKTVEADTVNGDFSLTGAASGGQWVLAESSGASDAPFSTYSYQDLNGSDLVLPMVPVDVLDDVAIQINVASFAADGAQLVVFVTDANGSPLPGVGVGPLGGATIGYELSSGQYALNPAETTDLGVAVALNASVGGEALVDVPFTYQNNVEKFSLKLAPGTVTFATVAIP